MNQVEVLYALMNRIVSDLNKRLPVSLALHQQQITTKNISLVGLMGGYGYLHVRAATIFRLAEFRSKMI